MSEPPFVPLFIHISSRISMHIAVIFSVTSHVQELALEAEMFCAYETHEIPLLGVIMFAYKAIFEKGRNRIPSPEQTPYRSATIGVL